MASFNLWDRMDSDDEEAAPETPDSQLHAATSPVGREPPDLQPPAAESPKSQRAGLPGLPMARGQTSHEDSDEDSDKDFWASRRAAPQPKAKEGKAVPKGNSKAVPAPKTKAKLKAKPKFKAAPKKTGKSKAAPAPKTNAKLDAKPKCKAAPKKKGESKAAPAPQTNPQHANKPTRRIRSKQNPKSKDEATTKSPSTKVRRGPCQGNHRSGAATIRGTKPEQMASPQLIHDFPRPRRKVRAGFVSTYLPSKGTRHCLCFLLWIVALLCVAVPLAIGSRPDRFRIRRRPRSIKVPGFRVRRDQVLGGVRRELATRPSQGAVCRRPQHV